MSDVCPRFWPDRLEDAQAGSPPLDVHPYSTLHPATHIHIDGKGNDRGLRCRLGVLDPHVASASCRFERRRLTSHPLCLRLRSSRHTSLPHGPPAYNCYDLTRSSSKRIATFDCRVTPLLLNSVRCPGSSVWLLSQPVPPTCTGDWASWRPAYGTPPIL